MCLCTIVNVSIGKKDFGISPGEGEISFTLRAEEEAHMKEMEKALLEKAEALFKTYHLALRYEKKIISRKPEIIKLPFTGFSGLQRSSKKKALK